MYRMYIHTYIYPGIIAEPELFRSRSAECTTGYHGVFLVSSISLQRKIKFHVCGKKIRIFFFNSNSTKFVIFSKMRSIVTIRIWYVNVYWNLDANTSIFKRATFTSFSHCGIEIKNDIGWPDPTHHQRIERCNRALCFMYLYVFLY